MNRRQFLTSSLAGLSTSPITSMAIQSQHIVPAEEAPHELTFMQWPVNKQVHPDLYFLSQLQRTISNIANTISVFEPV